MCTYCVYDIREPGTVIVCYIIHVVCQLRRDVYRQLLYYNTRTCTIVFMLIRVLYYA